MVQTLEVAPMSPFENQWPAISSPVLTEIGTSILKIHTHANDHSLPAQILQQLLVDFPSQILLLERAALSEALSPNEDDRWTCLQYESLSPAQSVFFSLLVQKFL